MSKTYTDMGRFQCRPIVVRKEKHGKHNYRELLSQKQYIKLLVADLISRFGDSLDAIAYSWLMYEVTGSESLMAVIIGLNYIPTVLLQPFAGTLVDRINKRFIMVVTDVLRFVIVALLVVLYINGALTSLIIGILTLCTSTIEYIRHERRYRQSGGNSTNLYFVERPP